MNADEVVEKVLPKLSADKDSDYDMGYFRAREIDRENLKIAILSGVLVPQERIRELEAEVDYKTRRWLEVCEERNNLLDKLDKLKTPNPS